MATPVPPLDSAVLRRLGEVIGDTNSGLTGSEIGRLLSEAQIPDPGEKTKRERLVEAFSLIQRRDGAANAVLRFISLVMRPVRFMGEPEAFEEWHGRLNEALAFSGLAIADDGRPRRREAAARTISDARARANNFKRQLDDRNVHPDVLRACPEEIANEDFFHAVFEAAKGLGERVRLLSKLTADGIPLVNDAFGRSDGLPRIAFNRLESRTDQSEHDGYANLMRGVFGAFRNTTAHRPKISWPMPRTVALNMMSTITLLHDRLDEAVEIPESVRKQAAEDAHRPSRADTSPVE